ncbi:hypothetical protein [Micromonospora sp. NPDC092111]|uniref:DUF7144 family membrane protein n=1 Tax=Micromonospora sp. NPDC092111 TaxID=3364289 RepID=UPI00382E8DF4
MATRQPDRSLPLAGGLLAGAGLFDILAGIGDLGGNVYVSLHSEGLVVYDITGWVWVHVTTGVLLMATGLPVALGRRRWGPVALVAGAVAVVVHLLFAPYHPVDALIVVGLVLAAVRLVVRHRRGSRPDEPVSPAGRPSR